MNNGESIRDDVRRASDGSDPATLERRSDAIRADVGQTLDALQRNYSPGALLDRSIDLFKEHGGELGANLGRSVKQNPMPALLTLVGVGWMMISDSRQREARSYYYVSDGLDDDSVDTSGTVDTGGTVGEKLGAAKDRARHARDSAVDSVRGGAHRVSEGSHRAAERAREQSRRAREGFRTMLEEQPFVVGALGIALGAVIGAVVPESEQEDRALGRARDRALERAKELGTRGYEQVRDKARQATQGAREAVEREGSHQDRPHVADPPGSAGTSGAGLGAAASTGTSPVADPPTRPGV